MKRLLFISFIGLFFLLSCSRVVRKQPTPTPAETPTEAETRAENFVGDGIDYYKVDKYRDAIRNWKKALEIIPQDAEVYNFMGLAYHKLGKLDSAIIAFNKAVELDSSYYQAWNNLGFMHFLKSDYQKALDYFDRSLKENPNYEQARLNRQKTEAILQGRLPIQAFELVEQAAKIDSLELQIANYRRALQIDSNYVDAWNNLGVAYYYYGNLDSAVYCLKKALDKNPDYPPAHNNAAYILDATGKYDEAIAHYQKAIQLRPNYLIAMVNLLDTYVHKKDYSSAREILDALRKIAPGYSLVRQRLEEYNFLLVKKNEDTGGK